VAVQVEYDSAGDSEVEGPVDELFFQVREVRQLGGFDLPLDLFVFGDGRLERHAIRIHHPVQHGGE